MRVSSNSLAEPHSFQRKTACARLSASLSARKRADRIVRQPLLPGSNRRLEWHLEARSLRRGGRWKAFRPEISPVPPARLLITAVATASSKSLAPDAPPLLISPARPIKQLATWKRQRSIGWSLARSE